MKLPWHTVEPLNARVFSELRRTAIFECCKWDPQVEDVSTLSPVPLVLLADAWAELVSLAEKLAHEAAAAEISILQKPSLLKTLGLPWSLRRRLADPRIAQAHHLRLVRFDFHFTTHGWRISEANTDVPGGFNEASGFTSLMAQHYHNARTAGDPTQAMAEAILGATGKSASVALAHATAYSDDRQVMTFLAKRLEESGLNPVLVAPDHLLWKDGRAFFASDWAEGPVDFIFRFFPADWLPALPRRCSWWELLGNSQTPLCNPASAIITQSKRFPLVWDDLPIRLPTWERLLPKTYDVRDVAKSGLHSESLVFKPAFGRVGDMVKIPGLTPEKETREIDRSIRRHPNQWIAQERFEAVPLPTPFGNVFPCIGIYTLNGKVIGAYGRIAPRPLINHLAQDAAVLIAETKRCSHDESIRNLQTLGA